MKKIRKIAALMVISALLCGSSLVATAACGHTSGARPVWSYTTRTPAGSHMYGNNQICNLTTITDHYNVLCNSCGSILSSYTSSYTGHSVVH